jgi:hypothetical protein
MSGRRQWDILINVWKEAVGYFDKCLEGGGGIF